MLTTQPHSSQVQVNDLGPVTKPGSGRRTGQPAALTPWSSTVAAEIAAAKAAALEAARAEDPDPDMQPAAEEAAAAPEAPQLDPATVDRRVKRKRKSLVMQTA